MNRWMQTKLYRCPKCEEMRLHDRMYHHALFQCVKRERPGIAGSKQETFSNQQEVV